MSLESDLIALIKTAANATVSTRVYYGEAPHNATFPFVRIQRFSAIPVYTMGGPIDNEPVRFQVDVFGKNFEETRTAANAISTALSGYSGTNSVTIEWIKKDGDRDDKQSDSKVARVILEFLVNWINT